MRTRVPHGSAVSMPAAGVIARAARPACASMRPDGVEGFGIGGFEREPGQSRAILVALSRAGAMPDIAGDVMVIASRGHEQRAVAAGASASSPIASR